MAPFITFSGTVDNILSMHSFYTLLRKMDFSPWLLYEPLSHFFLFFFLSSQKFNHLNSVAILFNRATLSSHHSVRHSQYAHQINVNALHNSKKKKNCASSPWIYPGKQWYIFLSLLLFVYVTTSQQRVNLGWGHY